MPDSWLQTTRETARPSTEYTMGSWLSTAGQTAAERGERRSQDSGSPQTTERTRRQEKVAIRHPRGRAHRAAIGLLPKRHATLRRAIRRRPPARTSWPARTPRSSVAPSLLHVVAHPALDGPPAARPRRRLRPEPAGGLRKAARYRQRPAAAAARNPAAGHGGRARVRSEASGSEERALAASRATNNSKNTEGAP